jgi:hypothetical protein
VDFADEFAEKIEDRAPVIGVIINGKAGGGAYPLAISMWHEIVNDKLSGIPIPFAFCPLCNSSIVFTCRLEGRLLGFGITRNLRRFDLVMYD